MRGEVYLLDPPTFFLAGGVRSAVGGLGVGWQDHGVRWIVLQTPAVERARSALHRHRRGDYGTGVRKYPLACLVIVGDRPNVLPKEELPRVRVLQVGLHVAELFGIQTLGGRYHRAVNVDKDIAVESVLLAEQLGYMKPYLQHTDP